MTGQEFASLWVNYLATWPAVIAFGPFLLVGAGVSGHRLAKAINEGKAIGISKLTWMLLFAALALVAKGRIW